MIEEGDVVAAGVSGGADSVCLLFVLCALRKRLGFQVKVCHVNHGLRGEEADADERYVEELCGTLDVPCRIFHKDVELIARKRKQSSEEAGRTARTEAFEEMCAQEGCTKIATAHHREDNAETVLLNAARGSGLKGLCGIRPVRGKWIRPLLSFTREQIESYLREQGISWCEDRTNQEDCYTRNRVRHYILPALEEQVNAGAARHLDELSRQAREVWDYLEYGVDRAYERCVRMEEAAVEPDAESGTEKDIRRGSARECDMEICEEELGREMPAVQNQLLKRCISQAAGSERDVGAVHVQAVRELFGRQTGRSICLPDGVRAERTYQGVRIWRGDKKEPEEETILKIPGETKIPGTGVVVTCTFPEDADRAGAEQIPQKSYTKWIDYDIIKVRLSVRTRRMGDYFVTGADGGRKKLKEYFINEKIPGKYRDKMLLVADGSHIVWIPGRRMSAAYQVRNETRQILEIKITEEKRDGRDNQGSDPGREG